MLSLYHKVCHQFSEMVTHSYSTSFSSAIKLLHKDLRKPVFDVYGFVRFADEIVDTFHEQDKEKMLQEFTDATWQAIENRFSIHPILYSFQEAVHRYNLPQELISAFLHSMKLDLHKQVYGTTEELDDYIFGSAEAVGLMCLCIFCEGNKPLYDSLKFSAQKLGAAFQKVNFLRDLQADNQQLNRAYFPGFDFLNFTKAAKEDIESSIEKDFNEGLKGIRQLPWKARHGVFTAYKYYRTLFKKIRNAPPKTILENRVRVPDYQKFFILMQAKIACRF